MCRVHLSSCNTEQLTSVATEVHSLTLQREPTGMEGKHNEPGRSYSFVSGAEASEIVRLYATGMSALAVGEKVGRPPRTVTDTLRKCGVEVRKNSPIARDVISEMVTLYEAGFSCAKIAKALGVSRSNVGKQLQRTGVALRNKSQAATLRDKL